MDFLRRLRRSSVDVPSTPTAPKIGRIPLPEISSPAIPRSPLAHADHDIIVVDRYPSPSSPLSPNPRKRAGSIVSRTATSTPLFTPRPHSPASSHPHPPTTPSTTELYAPTPKWHNQRTLLDHDWSSCSPTPDPHVLKERCTRTTSSSHHSPVPRASSSRHQYYDRRDSESPEDLKKHLKHRSESPRVQPPQPRSESRYSRRGETPEIEPAVKRPLKGILKTAPPKSARSETTSLHWLLLPYDPTHCRKKLFFDIALPPSNIRDHTTLPPISLHPSDTLKWAASPHQHTLTLMIIKIRILPHWDIIVQNDLGIRCIDVFEAIYRSLNLRLTEYEKEMYVGCLEGKERGDVESAFERRCRDVPREDRVVRREGLVRGDLLMGRRVFMGLTRPVEGGEFWWLHLGLPKVD